VISSGCFGGKRGGGGGELGKIHQLIKLFFFSADLQNEIIVGLLFKYIVHWS